MRRVTAGSGRLARALVGAALSCAVVATSGCDHGPLPSGVDASDGAPDADVDAGPAPGVGCGEPLPADQQPLTRPDTPLGAT